jgi:hypothetical protein
MLQSRELYRAATKLTAGDKRPAVARVTALLGALAMAIAESDGPNDTLNASIVMLDATRKVMPALRAQAVDAASKLGGVPS